MANDLRQIRIDEEHHLLDNTIKDFIKCAVQDKVCTTLCAWFRIKVAGELYCQDTCIGKKVEPS